jgi:hypothetical protein
VNQKALSIGSVVANNRGYNSTTLATLSNVGVLSGLVGSETLALSHTTAAFADQHAGTGKAVTVTGYSIANGTGLASDYVLASTTASTTANITAANLVLSTSNVSKTYDGNTSAAGSLIVSGGTLFGSDTIGGGTFAFTNANAGAGNKSVTTSGALVTDGNTGANYNVTYANNNTSTINQAALTLNATTDSKTYDGTTASAAAATTIGLVGSDTISGLIQTFASKNVLGLNGSTLNASGYTVNDGNSGGNYIVTSNSAVGTINPRNLNVTSVTGANKVFDSTVTANVFVFDDRISGDILNYASTAVFDTADVGSAKTVTVSAISLAGGGDLGNYVLLPPSLPMTTIADITGTATSNPETKDEVDKITNELTNTDVPEVSTVQLTLLDTDKIEQAITLDVPKGKVLSCQ